MIRMKHLLGIGLGAAVAALAMLSTSIPVTAQPAPQLGGVFVRDGSVGSTGAGCTPTIVSGCAGRVGFDKTQAVNTEGRRATYRAVILGLVPVASATDVVYIAGSATKTVRINRISVSGSAGTALNTPVVLAKRSTANTAGTCAAMTAVPIDTANAAATAVASSCTANPTLGTLVGNVASVSAMFNVGTAASVPAVFTNGIDNGQPIILRGVAQTLGVNLAGVSVSSGVLNVTIEWTEE